MIDAVSQFQKAIQSVGLDPPEHIEHGAIHRFPGVGKPRSNRAGWCLLFEDGCGGCFGDWSSGFTKTWYANRDPELRRESRNAFAHRAAQTQHKTQAERETRQNRAARRASAIWDGAIPARPEHPYLLRKGISPNGARLHKGSLVLPVMDFAGRLSSLQFIGADGRKLLLSGGRKQGCYIPVAGHIEGPCRVVICEGWATGCTLAKENSAGLVIAAIDAGNLTPVALGARRRWPSTELVVAGDDDRLTPDNPGAANARKAAIAANALLAFPEWPADAPRHLSDFNDLAVWLAGDAT